MIQRFLYYQPHPAVAATGDQTLPLLLLTISVVAAIVDSTFSLLSTIFVVAATGDSTLPYYQQSPLQQLLVIQPWLPSYW